MFDRRMLSFIVLCLFQIGSSPNQAFCEEIRRYGDVPAPKYDMIPMKKYDMVPLIQEKPALSENAPVESQPTKVDNPVPVQPPETQIEPKSSPNEGGERFQGIYFHMDGRTLHKWDFLEDGTFLHQIIAGGGGTAVRNSERGTYILNGGEITLKVNRSATAFSTPGIEDRGKKTTILGGGADDGGETRKAKLGFVGPKGADGITLDGVSMKPRKWQ